MKVSLKKVNKLFQNKFLLYFILAVALFNLVSFFMDKNYYAIVIFLTVAFLTTCITKNMTYVLLLPIILTNLLLTFKLHEGLENKNNDPIENTVESNHKKQDKKKKKLDSDSNNNLEEANSEPGSDDDSEQGSDPEPNNTESNASKKSKAPFQNFKNVQNLDQIDKTIQMIGPLMDKADAFLSRIEKGPFAGWVNKFSNNQE